MDNIIEEKSFRFAVRIVKLSGYLRRERKEFVLSKQLMRSGTSIGANVAEAQQAQSRADFHAKLSIALKEASETQYWLTLLYRTAFLNDIEFDSLNNDIKEIIAILTAICKTTDLEISEKSV